MSYREVTKDDVGRMVEVSDTDQYHKDCARKLAFIHDNQSMALFKYFTFNDDSENYITGWRNARIRTSPLPDGWLPDDWRVLGDEEVCKASDWIVFKNATGLAFDPKDNLSYHPIRNGYNGKTANYICSSAACTHHLCVIRPRWRKATKDDIGKTVYGKGGNEAVLKVIVDADSFGYDAICMSQMLGWCFSKLCDLKVENEGWHVTN
jgi:hypothetical protein